MAFNRKKIRLTLKLNGQNESFVSENTNKLSATGLRISADITAGNGAITPYARVKIYGLPQETMNKLIFLKWRKTDTLLNEITIEASNDDDEFIVVHRGGITFSLPDYAEAPNVAITIESITAIREAKTPTDAESYEGVHYVTGIIGGICKRMGFSFEPNDVEANIENAYLAGSNLDKIRWLCNNANINLYIEGQKVSVTKRGAARKNKIAMISPSTGLIGYPIPTDRGVMFKCLFNPNITFGGMVQIKDSIVELTNGNWYVFGIRTILETESESGRWFSEINAGNPTDGNIHVST